MAKQSELIESIKDVCQDTAFPSTTLLDLMNECQRKVAGGIFILFPDRTQMLSSPLAGLSTSGSLTTSTTYPYISMPSNYGRNLFFLVSETNDLRIEVFPSYGELLACYPVLENTGRVVAASVVGARLYYQGMPSTAETLTAYYYRKPHDMATLTGATDISFTATTLRIADAGNEMSKFKAGQTIDITGTTLNNTSFVVASVETDGSYLTTTVAPVLEANSSATIKSRPDGIPEHLHEDLLVNYAVMKVFERKAIAEKMNMQNVEAYKGYFRAAMLNLEMGLEEVGEPVQFVLGE